MNYKPQEIKTGIIITLSTIILLVFLIAISGLDCFNTDKQYLARFNYTSGLEIGSTVRYGGMKAGSVKDMTICEDDNSKIQFVLTLDENIPVKTNSIATVTSIGIMGESHINISTGHPDSSLLPPGSMLICKEVPSIMQLMEPIGQIAENVNQSSLELKRMLGQDTRLELQSILTNLNTLLSQNQSDVKSILDNLNKATIELSNLSSRMNTLVESNQETISQSLVNLDETLVRTKNLVQNLDSMMQNVDNIVVTKGYHLSEIIENLNQTTNNLEEFSRSIKEQPWQLIRKSAPPERKIK
ncbi:MCE family protein [candidate division KSB1 bacterium]|nr:MCE family protein [candidate division KSB1 bacterium]